MKSILSSNERKPETARRLTFASALLLLVSLLGAGCACCSKMKSSTKSLPEPTVLDESVGALKKQFNADTSKPRVLALFSPTCGGCIYGAKALQHEAQKFPEIVERADVMIVWMAMLESDNEREARKAVRKFDFEGAHHFYDGERRIGTRLMAEQFPNAVRDALEILPRDHELREMLESRKDLPPEKMPMWDAVLVFPPGVKWEERSPAPIWWTKQTSFIGEEKPGKMTAVFWKKSTRQPPVNSDWYLEAREAWRVSGDANNGIRQP